MSNRATSVMVVVLALLLGGCATVHDDGMGNGTSMDKCPKGHQAPSQISVVVYQDADGKVQVLPDRIVVEHPNQTIVWTAVSGEISDIVFEASECAPGPPAVRGQGKQRSTRIPAGHRGEHKYSLVFHPQAGGEMPVDPIAVVEY